MRLFSKLVLSCTAIAMIFMGTERTQAELIGGTAPAPVIPVGIDPTLEFTYSDTNLPDGDVASGLFTAIDLGNGSYLVTSGTLTVTGGPGADTYSVISPSDPGLSVYFNTDNLITPSAAQPLDVYGLAFVGSHGQYLNIWGNSPDNYSFYIGSNGGYPVAFTGVGEDAVTAVPEPSSFALLGLGGIGLAFGAHRRRRVAV